MKCPNCGNEMEKGRIQNPVRYFGMCWIPETEKKLQFLTENGVLKRKGVFLTGWELFFRGKSDLKCHLCRSCKTGIFQGV